MRVKAPAQGARLRSTAGVAIALGPNEVRDIPPLFRIAAAEAGCFLVEEADTIDEGGFQEDALRIAIQRLIDEGDPGKFRQDGLPKIAAVRELVGEVNASEVEAVFNELMDEGQ